MLYKIGNKFYIKVQGYYKEVDVKVNGNNLDIAPIENGDTIEVYGFEEVVIPFDMMIDKDEVINELKKASEFGSKKKEENSKYKSRII
jgi:hypothetical protein